MAGAIVSLASNAVPAVGRGAAFVAQAIMLVKRMAKVVNCMLLIETSSVWLE